MLKFNQKTKVSPQRRAAEELLQRLKPTLEMEAGRGAITINHYLQVRQSQNDEDWYPSQEAGSGFYAIEGVVATGGMGAILRAYDNNLQRPVALKVMLNSADATDSSIYSFVAEAQITGQLEHPNIVPLHDIGVSADGTIYYTMKLISGRTLREILKKIRDGDEEAIEKYPIDKLLTIFQKICDAMAYAHACTVVHRDLKPDNIMVGEFGEVLILDWGLAKVLTPEGDAHDKATEGSEFDGDLPGGADGFATMAGQVKGTPNYMAPEQAEGRVADIDNRTDLYALGGILYCILTLHPPITGANLDEILTRVTSSQIVPPLDYNKAEVQNPTGLPAPHCPEGKIPSALSAVAMKCMAYERDDRYMFCEALQGDIQLYQSGYATAAEDAGFFTQAKLLLSRNKKEVFFIILIIAGIVTTGVIAWGNVRLEAAKAREAQKETQKKIDELKLSAPAFLEVALNQILQKKYEDALEKLDKAIELDESDARFYKAKGDIYQTLMDIGKSREFYNIAEKKEPKGLADAALVEYTKQLRNSQTANGSILSRNESTLSNESLRQLVLLMGKQGRTSEAFTIAQVLAQRDRGLVEEYRQKLRLAGLFSTAKDDERLSRDPSGLFNLDLRGLDVVDISAVTGIPLMTANLAGCSKLTSIAPLQNMALKELDMSGTDVDDLSVLKTIPTLHKINMEGCKMVTDLSELQGLTNITWLNLKSSEVTSLNPLQGIPLTYLDLSNNKKIKDLTPLEGDTLEWLSIEKTSVLDISALNGAPLDYFNANECGIRSLAIFTNEAARLRTHVGLAGTFVRDLSPLKGKQTKSLDCYAGKMSDIEPLSGMPLEFLDLAEAPVQNISALRGMPLDTLILRDTKISDISPLADAQLTGKLDISGTKVADISVLKNTNLKELNFARCPINSLEPFRNHPDAIPPLRILRADALPTSPNLEPLWTFRGLEYLSIPYPGYNVPSLRQLELKKMTYFMRTKNVNDRRVEDWDHRNVTTKKKFWDEYDRRNR